jgi:hypothetical protein
VKTEVQIIRLPKVSYRALNVRWTKISVRCLLLHKQYSYIYLFLYKGKQVKCYPCNRPWRPIGLPVEAPTFYLDQGSGNFFTYYPKIYLFTPTLPPWFERTVYWIYLYGEYNYKYKKYKINAIQSINILIIKQKDLFENIFHFRFWRNYVASLLIQ